MDKRLSDRTVEAAAAWYARLQAPHCTQAERHAFERWRADHPSHAAAYAAARSLSSGLARAARTDPRLRAMAASARAPTASGARQGRYRAAKVAAALAAGVVTLIGAASLIPGPRGERAAATHYTAQSGPRVLTLEDGSIVHLDIDSTIDVRFRGHGRDVELERGRAVFEVAHDASRPFAVSAGRGRVTAVGTRFQVERAHAAVVVTLAEGIVTVSGERDGAEHTERLLPGDELRLTAESDWIKQTVDPRVATSWSTGRLLFRQTKLADALEQVNRYAATKVRLADPSIADLPVSGNFVAGDSAATVAAFAAVLPLRIAEGRGELLLYREPNERR